jgi:hypothetical protein
MTMQFMPQMHGEGYNPRYNIPQPRQARERGQSSADFLAETLGKGLGGGLEKGLNYGIEKMLQRKENRKYNSAIARQMGLQEDAFGDENPEIAKAVFSSSLEQRKQEQKVRSKVKLLQDILPELGGQPNQPYQAPVNQALNRAFYGQQLENMNQMGDQPMQGPAKLQQQQFPQQNPQQFIQQRQIQQETPTSNITSNPQQRLAAAIVDPSIANTMTQNEKIASAARQAELTRADRKTEADRKFEAKTESENRKESKEFRDKIFATHQAHIKNKVNIQHLRSLAKSGTLPEPAMVALLDKVGLPLGILNNPNSEEYQKRVYDFTSGITGDYGARILASEFGIFLQRIPTLLNSNEGRLQILDMMEQIGEMNDTYYQSYKETMKENNGKTPKDIEISVFDKVEPLINDLMSDLSQGEKITLYKDGKTYRIPINEAQKAIQEGGFGF